jgi:hypothetical protein
MAKMSWCSQGSDLGLNSLVNSDTFFFSEGVEDGSWKPDAIPYYFEAVILLCNVSLASMCDAMERAGS